MKTKKIFLVFAPGGPQSEQIQGHLEATASVQVDVVTTAQEASKKLGSGDVTCLVFITNQFDSNSVKFLTGLRETRKQLAVIVFTSKVSKDIYTFTNTTKLRRVAIMEIPYDPNDLKTICEKIVNGQEVSHRNYERFS